MEYKEPRLTYLVLDYKKEAETRRCLSSIKEHTKFPHKIVYLHNGDSEEYPYALFKEGLLDQCILTKKNEGLAIGTRNLFVASFSTYSFYLQNDQYLKRDFTEEEFEKTIALIGTFYRSPEDGTPWEVRSVDLAGGVFGKPIYSERGHIIETKWYKEMEENLDLGHHGAGPHHDGAWREERIQKFYKANKFIHFTTSESLVEDNGYRAIRENPDGSVWEHKTDTKELRLVKGPVKENHSYPELTETEWDEVLKTQAWPKWQVPEKDRGRSYKRWSA